MEANTPVEIDIHQVASGELVVCHDNFLSTGGIPRPMSSYHYRDIQSRIPLLSEVLDMVSGRIPLMLDIKCSRSTGRLEGVLERQLKSYRGDCALLSFNPSCLVRLRRVLPSLPYGIRVGDIAADTPISWWKKYWAYSFFFFHQIKPEFIACQWVRLDSLPLQWIRLGGQSILLAWTIESPEQWAQCAKFCHNIIFENFSPSARVEC